jgi:isoamylase
LLATLLLSFGIPMIVGGDELGRTQQGNNNAYCQDNPITWFDWSAVDKDLLAFTRRLVAVRQTHPVFRRRRFLIGAEAAELLWFTPAGTPMTEAGWRDPDARSLALYLDGADAPDLAADGSPMLDDDFLLLVNAWWERLDFTIPPTRPGQTWLREIDTFDPPESGPQPLPVPPTRSSSDPAPSWCSAPRQHPDGAARQLEVRPAPRRRA